MILVEKWIMPYEKYQDNMNLCTFCIGKVCEVEKVIKNKSELKSLMTSLAIAHATNHNDFVKIWNEIWDLHKLDFDLCANCGLKHLKGTKCHLQPEKETWFFEKMDDNTKSPSESN